MKALLALAEFIQAPELANPPAERFDRLKRHVVDTIGARLAGSTTDEGAAVARVADTIHDETLAAILVCCAQARCTEADDIHLTSCTTPGAVVVSTALALAEARDLQSMRGFAAALLAGYEGMIRLGVAIDGPMVLHKGIWPTQQAAAFGSTAVACRTYGLTVRETASALATTLALAGGAPVPSAPPMTSRWLTLAMGAVNGVIAARSARAQLVGTTTAALKRLTAGLGR